MVSGGVVKPGFPSWPHLGGPGSHWCLTVAPLGGPKGARVRRQGGYGPAGPLLAKGLNIGSLLGWHFSKGDKYGWWNLKSTTAEGQHIYNYDLAYNSRSW